MATIDITDTLTSTVQQRMNQFRALVQRYHADPNYRRQVETDPVAAFREQRVELPSDIAIRVLANTDDTLYMVLPPDPNMDLGDEMLTAIAGGGHTLASAGTASTAGTVGGSLSTGASVTTVSTMG